MCFSSKVVAVCMLMADGWRVLGAHAAPRLHHAAPALPPRAALVSSRGLHGHDDWHSSRACCWRCSCILWTQVVQLCADLLRAGA